MCEETTMIPWFVSKVEIDPSNNEELNKAPAFISDRTEISSIIFEIIPDEELDNLDNVDLGSLSNIIDEVNWEANTTISLDKFTTTFNTIDLNEYPDLCVIMRLLETCKEPDKVKIKLGVGIKLMF